MSAGPGSNPTYQLSLLDLVKITNGRLSYSYNGADQFEVRLETPSGVMTMAPDESTLLELHLTASLSAQAESRAQVPENVPAE